MDHGDDDWDSNLAQILLLVIVDSEGEFRWFGFVLLAAACTLLAYHYWG